MEIVFVLSFKFLGKTSEICINTMSPAIVFLWVDFAWDMRILSGRKEIANLIFFCLFFLKKIDQFVDDRIIWFILLSQLNKPVSCAHLDLNTRLWHLFNDSFSIHNYLIVILRSMHYYLWIPSIHHSQVVRNGVDIYESPSNLCFFSDLPAFGIRV